jgi:putative FmdB family regulatory protein
MPTYDYECDACHHKFEIFQNMSDELLTKCPKCKKKKLRRLFGAGAAVMFKGSGFYQTDYRSDSYKKSAAAEKTASEPAASFSDTKSSETKSETKSESKSAESKPAAESKPSAPSKPEKKK